MFDADDDDDDEESGLGSNEWPLGSDTFPRDLRHPSLRGTHARARCLYGKKTTGSSHNKVYCFYFEAAIEFSRNSSDIRGNAL